MVSTSTPRVEQGTGGGGVAAEGTESTEIRGTRQ